jgi:hypothetical protein
MNRNWEKNVIQAFFFFLQKAHGTNLARKV